MSAYIHKLSIILVIAIALAITPFYRVFSACQKSGEFCGDPSTPLFPGCCPFDEDSDGKQIDLDCKDDDDDGIGICEDSTSSSSSSSSGH